LDSEGIGRNYTGIIRASTEAQARVRLEMEERRRGGDQVRGALYREIIQGKVGALGISATNASLYVTLTLSLTQLRDWVTTRLKPLIAAIQKDAATQPRITTAMYSLRGIPRTQRRAVRSILVAALTARIMDRPSAALGEPLPGVRLELGDQLRFYVLAPCARCEGTEEILHCNRCDRTEVEVDGDVVTCATCRTQTQLTCDNDHEVRLPPLDWLLAVPVESLRRSLIDGLGRTGQLDLERGYLVIWNGRVWVGNTPDSGDRIITFNIADQARAAVNLDSPGATITITGVEDGADDGRQENNHK
jgi:hypothetical protein